MPLPPLPPVINFPVFVPVVPWPVAPLPPNAYVNAYANVYGNSHGPANMACNTGHAINSYGAQHSAHGVHGPDSAHSAYGAHSASSNAMPFNEAPAYAQSTYAPAYTHFVPNLPSMPNMPNRSVQTNHLIGINPDQSSQDCEHHLFNKQPIAPIWDNVIKALEQTPPAIRFLELIYLLQNSNTEIPASVVLNISYKIPELLLDLHRCRDQAHVLSEWINAFFKFPTFSTTHRVINTYLLQATLNFMVGKSYKFNNHQIRAILYGIKNLSLSEATVSVFKMMAKHISAVPQLSPQTISDSFYGLKKTKWCPEVEKLLSTFVPHLNGPIQLTDEMLGKCLYGLIGICDCPAKRQIMAALVRHVKHIPHISVHALSNCLTGFKNTVLCDEVKALMTELLPHIRKSRPLSVAIVTDLLNNFSNIEDCAELRALFSALTIHLQYREPHVFDKPIRGLFGLKHAQPCAEVDELLNASLPHIKNNTALIGEEAITGCFTGLRNLCHLPVTQEIFEILFPHIQNIFPVRKRTLCTILFCLQTLSNEFIAQKIIRALRHAVYRRDIVFNQQCVVPPPSEQMGFLADMILVLGPHFINPENTAQAEQTRQEAYEFLQELYQKIFVPTLPSLEALSDKNNQHEIIYEMLERDHISLAKDALGQQKIDMNLQHCSYELAAVFCQTFLEKYLANYERTGDKTPIRLFYSYTSCIPWQEGKMKAVLKKFSETQDCAKFFEWKYWTNTCVELQLRTF